MRALRRRPLLVGSAVVLALVAGLVFLFFYSRAFVVEEVTTTGGDEELQESALTLAQIPQGRPLARVSASRVTERVLEDMRVADLEVQRHWPSSVTLAVTPREPVLALRGGGQTWLADQEGVVYAEAEGEGEADDLPVVTVRGVAPPELDAATVTGVVELWRARPDADELDGGDPSAPQVDRHGAVTMSLGSVDILWGAPTDNAMKWQVVQALLAQESIDPEGEAPAAIDVTIPDTPIVTGLPASE